MTFSISMLTVEDYLWEGAENASGSACHPPGQGHAATGDAIPDHWQAHMRARMRMQQEADASKRLTSANNNGTHKGSSSRTRHPDGWLRRMGLAGISRRTHHSTHPTSHCASCGCIIDEQRVLNASLAQQPSFPFGKADLQVPTSFSDQPLCHAWVGSSWQSMTTQCGVASADEAEVGLAEQVLPLVSVSAGPGLSQRLQAPSPTPSEEEIQPLLSSNASSSAHKDQYHQTRCPHSSGQGSMAQGEASANSVLQSSLETGAQYASTHPSQSWHHLQSSVACSGLFGNTFDGKQPLLLCHGCHLGSLGCAGGKAAADAHDTDGNIKITSHKWREDGPAYIVLCVLSFGTFACCKSRKPRQAL